MLAHEIEIFGKEKFFDNIYIYMDIYIYLKIIYRSIQGEKIIVLFGI